LTDIFIQPRTEPSSPDLPVANHARPRLRLVTKARSSNIAPKQAGLLAHT